MIWKIIVFKLMLASKLKMEFMSCVKNPVGKVLCSSNLDERSNILNIKKFSLWTEIYTLPYNIKQWFFMLCLPLRCSILHAVSDSTLIMKNACGCGLVIWATPSVQHHSRSPRLISKLSRGKEKYHITNSQGWIETAGTQSCVKLLSKKSCPRNCQTYQKEENV